MTLSSIKEHNTATALAAKLARKNRFTFALIFFLLLGVISISLFHFDLYFPIGLSIALMGIIIMFYLNQLKKDHIGLVSFIILGMYMIPFIHILPYIWFDFESEPFILGLVIIPDKKIIELTAMLCVTGTAGMAFSASLFNIPLIRDNGFNPDKTRRLFKSMNFLIWIFWLCVGLFFSITSAPGGSFFESQYFGKTTIDQNWNFDSSWMVSYIILTFIYADALLDVKSTQKYLKKFLIFASIAFILIKLQLLAGSRESLAWIFGLLLVYYYWATFFLTNKKTTKSFWIKTVILIFIIAFISMVIGFIRSEVSGGDLNMAKELLSKKFSDGSLSLSYMFYGTWSSSLLTVLSVTEDYIYGISQMKLGKDYLNIFLSLSPGFVADFFDYVRPLTNIKGPAYEMRYGQGGTHAAVLPFTNFGMVGVFIIPALWSYIILRLENSAIIQFSVINLSLLVTLVMASPHFLWYGEKTGINAIIIFFILSFFYKISLRLSSNIKNQKGL
jgi:hypothetical protein